MIHQLKCLTGYFEMTAAGIKTFEVRFNDRNFQVDDEVILSEYVWEDGTYTGNHIRARIVYILDGFYGLGEGFVCLQLADFRKYTEN